MARKHKWGAHKPKINREIVVDFGGTSPSRGVAIPPGWWPAKGGGFIQIKDMAFDHIQAALNRIGPGHYKYAELREELGRRELIIARVAMERMRETNKSLEKYADRILYGGTRGGGLSFGRIWHDEGTPVWPRTPLLASEIGDEIDKVLDKNEVDKAHTSGLKNKASPDFKEPGKKKVRVIRKEKK